MSLSLLKIIQSAACSLFSLFAQSAATRCSPPPLRANKPSKCKHRKITVLSWDAEMLGKFFFFIPTFLGKMLPDLPFLGAISLLEELCDPPLKSNDIISLCFPDRLSFFLIGFWEVGGHLSPQCHPNGNGYPGCC